MTSLNDPLTQMYVINIYISVILYEFISHEINDRHGPDKIFVYSLNNAGSFTGSIALVMGIIKFT